MEFGAIIAARLASTRLPGKAMFPLFGIPVIALVIQRIKTSQLLDDIILATTENNEDDVLEQLALELKIKVYRGSVNDVLGRYVEAAKLGNFQYAVRITADCPFVYGKSLDFILSEFQEFGTPDLITTKPAYPRGIDYEIYRTGLLQEINAMNDLTPEDREHILNHLYRKEHLYKIIRVKPPAELKTETDFFLLDTPDDYLKMLRLTREIKDLQVSPAEIIRLLKNEN